MRLARRLAAALAVAFVVVTSSLIGGSTAAAATPIVVGSCAATVQGAPGTPIQLQPAAVLEPVVNVVQAIDLLGVITPAVRSAFAKMPPIPIGSIPTGTGMITAGQITNAVVGELNKIPLVGPIIGKVTQGLQSTFAGICGVTVKAANTVAAQAQDNTAALAEKANQSASTVFPNAGGRAATTPGTPGKPDSKPITGNGHGTTSPPPMAQLPVVDGFGFPTAPPVGSWNWNAARSPMTDYSTIPFAQAGLYAPSPGVRYGGGVPGYSPQFGILGVDNPPNDGVQAAGHAEAIGTPPSRDIDISVLIAVLALSGVTAALVRTWVLRKAV
ncbi:hypothetical protein JOF56_002277 [Kibdelosporangium banguiense]|uniref:Uncharacterized protein n=1 Tax=Kibdelosporangium banguiense TaxID=1365924 RepID=A0ABS4TBT8_9PSEU|nr:hypothetical protein [Kibdelosporangium banguiense]MBP2321892.1 hypothetical protein [Kibdelosporangium banguiense]